MKRYKVTMSPSAIEDTIVEVEAENIKEAFTLAERIFDENFMAQDVYWEARYGEEI
jgi:hypothetical protein